ncbi:MAG: LamG-like jellyroll fold domain-containing protein [Bacteroidota bacterium]
MKNFMILLFCLFATSACISQTCLLADYPFQGNAIDKTGKGFDGIPTTPQSIEDRLGNPHSAYLFNGYSDYIKLNDNRAIVTSENFSITVWAKINGRGGGLEGSNPIFVQRDDKAIAPNLTSLIGLFADYYGNATFMVRTKDPSAYSPIQARSRVPSDGDWHFYAAVKDDRSLKLYIDSVLVDVQTFNDGEVFGRSIDYVEVGRHSYEGIPRSYFNGAIDDLRLYNCALKELDILDVLTNTKEQYSLGQSSCVEDVVPSPNPTSGLVHLQSLGDFSGSVELFDILGRPMSGTYQWKGNQLDLSNLPPSTYLLKVNCDNSSKVFRIVRRME